MRAPTCVALGHDEPAALCDDYAHGLLSLGGRDGEVYAQVLDLGQVYTARRIVYIHAAPALARRVAQRLDGRLAIAGRA